MLGTLCFDTLSLLFLFLSLIVCVHAHVPACVVMNIYGHNQIFCKVILYYKLQY